MDGRLPGKRSLRPSLILMLCLLLVGVIGSLSALRDRVSINGAPATNLILICVDAVRYDTFWLAESAGQEDSLTRWNRNALRFRRAQSTAPWTIPAVVSVMSGLYPLQHAAGQMEKPVADLAVQNPSGMPAQVTVLAEILASHQYETLALVSHPWISRESGILDGMADVQFVADGRIVEMTKLWLRRRQSPSPSFFMYLHFMKAHDEHWKPEEELDRRFASLSPALKEAIDRSAPAGVCGDPDYEMCRRFRAYAAAILSLRKDVAEILMFLSKTGLLSNTMVILYSDHGEEFEDHRAIEQELGLSPRDGNIGHGHGHTMYQELLHVPLLIWHPSFHGHDITVAVSLIDIVPTVIDWLKLDDARASYPGMSLADIPNLNRRPELMNRFLFSSGIGYGPEQYAVLWKHWKGTFIKPDAFLLFHLQQDPAETAPWQGDAPRELLHGQSAAYSRMKSDYKAQPFSLPREQEEMLQSIGYLTAGKEKGRPVARTFVAE